jgi:glycosyltransferase involved in cell wall biosynthesis
MARVCMVALTDYPADTRVRREAEALAERGDEVVVVCPRTRSVTGPGFSGGVELHPVGRFAYTSETTQRSYLSRYAGFQVRATAAILALHARRRFDVVHVNTMPDVLAFTAAGAKALGAQVLLDVHDLMPELYASKYGLDEGHALVRLLRFLERRSIAFADRALAVHGPHLDALVAHGNDRSRFDVLLNVPDPALFRRRESAPPPEPFTLVYHGCIGQRNGLDVAVRAIALARREVPGVRLHVIGDGDAADALHALIAELGVGDVVRFDQGLFPVDELVPIVAAANAGIVPIHDDAFTRYMLPVKLLEYVAVGLPVIASDTSTIRAYFGDGELAFARAGDHEQLAARIVELARDPDLCARQVEAASRFAEAHRWDVEKRTYYEVIDGLAARARTRARRRPRRPMRTETEVGGT